MNGSRLSDDAALLRGVEWLQRQAAGDAIDATDTERALGMIAMRYPDAADELRDLWQEGHNAAPNAAMAARLTRLQEQYRQDCEEDA